MAGVLIQSMGRRTRCIAPTQPLLHGQADSAVMPLLFSCVSVSSRLWSVTHHAVVGRLKPKAAGLRPRAALTNVYG